MFIEQVSLITDVIVPIVISVAVLSRVSSARNNEKLVYALIGMLANKSILDMQDLMTLHMFEPRGDMLDLLQGLIKR